MRVNGRIVEPDIGVAVRQGRCGAAYFLLLVCFFLPPLFSVAVSVLGSVRLERYLHVSILGSVRLERYLHELAVVGLRCE